MSSGTSIRWGVPGVPETGVYSEGGYGDHPFTSGEPPSLGQRPWCRTLETCTLGGGRKMEPRPPFLESFAVRDEYPCPRSLGRLIQSPRLGTGPSGRVIGVDGSLPLPQRGPRLECLVIREVGTSETGPQTDDGGGRGWVRRPGRWSVLHRPPGPVSGLATPGVRLGPVPSLSFPGGRSW